MHLSNSKYEIDIYGDGNREYNGFYMVVVCKFDSDKEDAKPIGQKTYYFKSDYKTLIEYLQNNIDYIYRYGNCSKWRLQKTIEAIKLPY